MNAIETAQLTKTFGAETAVDSLNMVVRPGELFALLGVNGAGKTTTIRMLSCLLPPTSGQAWILDRDVVSQASEVRKIINVSPQDTAVASHLSVRENLEFIARIYGSCRQEAISKTAEMLLAFGLKQSAGDKAKTLSGGMQRRLSIAMAMITNPEVLFLDEPTLGVDVLARRELWSFIRSLKGKVTIILTTHYMEEVEALADRVGIMAEGKMAAVGTVPELLHRSDKSTLEDAFVHFAIGLGEGK